MRNIDFIIVHCSATANYVSFDTLKKNALEEGYNDIPYHFVIAYNGFMHEGRNLETVGAHCKGFNQHSIGICLVGGKSRFDFSLKQILSLVSLLQSLCKDYNLTKKDIYSHYEINKNKMCPQFSIKNLLEYENF